VNCIDLVERITEYLEGALAPQARDRVEEHLAACDGCTAYIEQMRTTIRITGTLTEENVPAEARVALLEVFRSIRSA